MHSTGRKEIETNLQPPRGSIHSTSMQAVVLGVNGRVQTAVSIQPGAVHARRIEAQHGLASRCHGDHAAVTAQFLELALHHLFAEVLDNAMDEAVARHAKQIKVDLDADGWLTVFDDGRGIPVDPHPKHPGKSALEVVMTRPVRPKCTPMFTGEVWLIILM